MASRKQLVDRWVSGPGKRNLLCVQDFFASALSPGHGLDMDKLFLCLDGLPFREELPGGRDFRGVVLGGGVHELDLSRCDFSHASLNVNLVNCDLRNSVFDSASFIRLVTRIMEGASFKKAKMVKCSLRGGDARSCCFDGANLQGTSFEEADLAGSSFRAANCRRANFYRANLLGCDFQGAVLDEAAFQEVKIDKSTNLRGASLVDLYHESHIDRSGKVVSRGTDWRLASYDASTKFGHDPKGQALELLDSAESLLESGQDSHAGRLRREIGLMRVEISNKYRDDWYDELLRRLPSESRNYAEVHFTSASRNLV